VALLALVAAAWCGPGWAGALALAVAAAAAALRHQGQRWLDGLQRGSGLPPRNHRKGR
jgi:sugar/nucleoside kinase (ribokinase family)